MLEGVVQDFSKALKLRHDIGLFSATISKDLIDAKDLKYLDLSSNLLNSLASPLYTKQEITAKDVENLYKPYSSMLDKAFEVLSATKHRNKNKEKLFLQVIEAIRHAPLALNQIKQHCLNNQRLKDNSVIIKNEYLMIDKLKKIHKLLSTNFEYKNSKSFLEANAYLAVLFAVSYNSLVTSADCNNNWDKMVVLAEKTNYWVDQVSEKAYGGFGEISIPYYKSHQLVRFDDFKNSFKAALNMSMFILYLEKGHTLTVEKFLDRVLESQPYMVAGYISDISKYIINLANLHPEKANYWTERFLKYISKDLDKLDNAGRALVAKSQQFFGSFRAEFLLPRIAAELQSKLQDRCLNNLTVKFDKTLAEIVITFKNELSELPKTNHLKSELVFSKNKITIKYNANDSIKTILSFMRALDNKLNEHNSVGSQVSVDVADVEHAFLNPDLGNKVENDGCHNHIEDKLNLREEIDRAKTEDKAKQKEKVKTKGEAKQEELLSDIESELTHSPYPDSIELEGGFIPKGVFYAYGLQLTPDLSSISNQDRAHYQEILNDGQIVPKGRQGLRVVSTKESGLDHLTFKITCPKKDLRVLLLREQETKHPDGKTTYLYRAGAPKFHKK